MNKQPLILIGGGGHCRACIDVIQQEGKFIIKGILDAELQKGETVAGYPVLGNDNVIEELTKQGYFFFDNRGAGKISGRKG